MGSLSLYCRIETVPPVLIDLCCGKRFGWTRGFVAEGWHAIGFDIEPVPDYPGEFHQQDVRTLSGKSLARTYSPAVFVASPPCQEFTRQMLPWTKAKNPPEPDLSIIEACQRIAREAGLPLVMENVRKAQDYIGTAKAHYGSRYLWGDIPPLLPLAEPSRKEHLSSTAVAERSEIPFELSSYIARVFKP